MPPPPRSKAKTAPPVKPQKPPSGPPSAAKSGTPPAKSKPSALPAKAKSASAPPSGDFRPAVSSPRSAIWMHILSGAFFALLTCILVEEVGLLWLLPSLRSVPDISVLFLVLGVVLGALRRDKWLQITTGIAAFFWVIVAFSPLASRLAAPLPLQAAPTEIARGADAVVVLASRIQNDGDFTNVSLQRLMRGLELVRSGHAPVLVLSEVRPPSGSYEQAAKTLTGNLQIPVNLVVLKGPMRDTHDEAGAVAKLAKERGWKRIFLVTSPTHTRRASMVFRHSAQAIKLVVLPVASQETDTDLETLDNPGDRLRAFGMAIHEWLGIEIYRRRGWI